MNRSIVMFFSSMFPAWFLYPLCNIPNIAVIFSVISNIFTNIARKRTQHISTFHMVNKRLVAAQKTGDIAEASRLKQQYCETDKFVFHDGFFWGGTAFTIIRFTLNTGSPPMLYFLYMLYITKHFYLFYLLYKELL